jgi:hypothetical protein
MDALAEASSEDVLAAVMTVYREDGEPYGSDEVGLMRWIRQALIDPNRRARILAALPDRPDRRSA